MSLPLNVLPSPQMSTSSSRIAATSIVPVTARPSGVVLKYGLAGRVIWNAPHCSAAMPSATSCCRHSIEPRLLGAVRHRLARDLVVVGLVGLAEVGRVGVRDRALRSHPMKGGAGVQAAGECDADFLADGRR
jgi:hypothetical protein